MKAHGILVLGLFALFGCGPGGFDKPAPVAHGYSGAAPAAIFLDQNGNDSRREMTSDVFPWSAIGRITHDNGDGTMDICTGALVGKHVVLTAAHCALHNGAIVGVNFEANYVNGAYHGSSDSVRITVGTLDPNGNREGDWAVVALDQDLGTAQGFFGVQTPDASEFPLNVSFAGYSNDFHDSEIAGADNCYLRTAYGDGTFGHDCSTEPGASGGPLFIGNGDDHIVGVNTRGIDGGVYSQYTPQNGNVAAMTAETVQTVIDYKNQYDQ